MANNKKNASSSLVPANTSEISVQFNDSEVNEQISNALDVRKENMIMQQAEIMDIVLFADDIKEIKSNLGDEYLNAAMLEVAVVNALVDYQENLQSVVDAETTKAMQRLAAIKNKSSANSKAKWAEMQSKAQECTKSWESLRDWAEEKFKIENVNLKSN